MLGVGKSILDVYNPIRENIVKLIFPPTAATDASGDSLNPKDLLAKEEIKAILPFNIKVATGEINYYDILESEEAEVAEAAGTLIK